MKGEFKKDRNDGTKGSLELFASHVRVTTCSFTYACTPGKGVLHNSNLVKNRVVRKPEVSMLYKNIDSSVVACRVDSCASVIQGLLLSTSLGYRWKIVSYEQLFQRSEPSRLHHHQLQRLQNGSS